MTIARLTPINTRTTRGLAIVRDALDGRRNHDRADTCIVQRPSIARVGSAFRSAVDEVGRAFADSIINFASNQPFRLSS